MATRRSRAVCSVSRFAPSGEVQALLHDSTDAEFAGIDVGQYTEDDYVEDLDRVSEGLADPAMVRLLTGRAYDTMRWLGDNGVRWVLATGRQAYKVDGKMRFFGNLIVEASGGGRGLSDGLFARATALGIDLWYRAAADVDHVRGRPRSRGRGEVPG